MILGLTEVQLRRLVVQQRVWYHDFGGRIRFRPIKLDEMRGRLVP